MILLVCAGLAGFTGTRLGECWNFLLQKHPELKEHCPSPYPEIAFYAMGKPGRIMVEISVYLTLFGAGVVMLLLCAGNLGKFIIGITMRIVESDDPCHHWIESHPITYTCVLAVIVTVVTTPMTFARSPAEMPWVAIAATVTTAAACLFIVIQIIVEGVTDPVLTHFNQTANCSVLANNIRFVTCSRWKKSSLSRSYLLFYPISYSN